MRNSARSFLEKALDAVEEREAALLVWGVVDSHFSRAELAEIIDPLIDEALGAGSEDYLAANEVISDLVDLKWLVEVQAETGAECFRSRMAETVRLLLRLRQLFPKHGRTE